MITVFKSDKTGLFHWKVTFPNGNHLAEGEVGFPRPMGAINHLRALKNRLHEWDGKTYLQEKKKRVHNPPKVPNPNQSIGFPVPENKNEVTVLKEEQVDPTLFNEVDPHNPKLKENQGTLRYPVKDPETTQNDLDIAPDRWQK